MCHLTLPFTGCMTTRRASLGLLWNVEWPIELSCSSSGNWVREMPLAHTAGLQRDPLSFPMFCPNERCVEQEGTRGDPSSVVLSYVPTVPRNPALSIICNLCPLWSYLCETIKQIRIQMFSPPRKHFENWKQVSMVPSFTHLDIDHICAPLVPEEVEEGPSSWPASCLFKRRHWCVWQAVSLTLGINPTPGT